MRVPLLVSWLALASCNRLLGLDTTVELDAPPPPDAAPDAFVLLTPPATNPPCGAPIPFETWNPHPRAVVDAVIGMAFYRIDNASERMMLSIDKQIYDWDLVGAPMPIPNLDAPTTYGTLGLSPDAGVLWVGNGGDVFYATRASGWVKTPATFGFPQQTVSPSNVAFYGGAARMMLVVSTGTTPPQLVEVSSPDGLEWTPVDTIKFSTRVPGYATLSRDGCFVMFTDLSTGSVSKGFIAFRDPDGTFRAPPIQLPQPALVQRYLPALMTDLSALWFIDLPSAAPAQFTMLQP